MACDGAPQVRQGLSTGSTSVKVISRCRAADCDEVAVPNRVNRALSRDVAKGRAHRRLAGRLYFRATPSAESNAQRVRRAAVAPCARLYTMLRFVY